MIDISRNYVFSEKVAEIIGLAIKSRKNALLWGPAGYGKSEMSLECVKNAGFGEDCFIQSFGEGMDESRLYGGIDFAALKHKDIMTFNTDRSFLKKKVAIFEEIFDAPAIVLQSLKDTLTSRWLRNGAQQVEMQTNCIIAVTNTDPREVSELSASAHALVERFPLQLEVKWEDHSASAYFDMFSTVRPSAKHETRKFLSRLVERAREEGAQISPRTAMHALDAIMVTGENDDSYSCLEYIPGFENVITEVKKEIREIRLREQARESLGEIYREVKKLRDRLESMQYQDDTNSLKYLNIAKDFKACISLINELPVPDPLVEERDGLLNQCSQSMIAAQDLAMDTSTNYLEDTHGSQD